MKFDAQKSFGYPVLREGSADYTSGAFQNSVGLAAKPDEHKRLYDLSYEIAISVDEIENLVKSGSAFYLLVVNCNSTLYQKVVRLDESQVEGVIEIEADLVRNELEIASYVVAEKEIAGFECKDINREFNQDSFAFEAGTVLACTTPIIYYVDRDVLKNITSMFDFEEDEKMKYGRWRLHFDSDRVKITASTKQVELLNDAANNRENQGVMLNSIFLPAIIQLLEALKTDGDDYDDKRWAKILRSKCGNHGSVLSPGEDTLSLAQALLGQPLGRLNSDIFNDTGSS